jgi:hypothetical protein
VTHYTQYGIPPASLYVKVGCAEHVTNYTNQKERLLMVITSRLLRRKFCLIIWEIWQVNMKVQHFPWAKDSYSMDQEISENSSSRFNPILIHQYNPVYISTAYFDNISQAPFVPQILQAHTLHFICTTFIME